MRTFEPGTALRMAFSTRSCRRYFAAVVPLGLLNSAPSGGAQARAGVATRTVAVRAAASAVVNLVSMVFLQGRTAPTDG